MLGKKKGISLILFLWSPLLLLGQIDKIVVDPNLIFHLQFLAVVAFVSFAAFLKYLQTKNPDFLYASLYLLVNFLYFMRWFGGNLPLIQPLFTLQQQQKINNWVSGDFWTCSMEVPLLLLLIITYALFLKYFFALDQHAPKIFKNLQRLIQFLLVIVGLYLFGGLFLYRFSFFQQMVSSTGNTITAILLLVPSGIFLRHAVKQGIGTRNRYYWYFMLGTAILILGPLLTQLSFYFNSLFSGLDSFLYVEISVLLEIAFFYQALSIKEDYFYEDRDRTARALAEQQAANQTLQINKLEADFNALKAQMNPHFIFNSLNSLKALIQEQQTPEAIDYLVKFSALVRVALEKADQALITLEEEVEFCQNYLAIEALRMPDLVYEVQIEESLDLSFLEIPPFILQPFLENSLRHGLALQEGPRNLHFIIQSYEEGIQCIIDDSGVGREKAKQLKSLTKTERKRSLGIQNIQDRLDMHHQIYQHQIDFKLTDKKDATGQASGTRVDLFIPD
ncbi:MAG: hypothetical protein Sapg2KO_00140 [Saprospiraceae bacterium]